MNLHQLQAAFGGVVRDGQIATVAGLAPGEIVPGGTLSAEEAIDVYRNGYLARLTDALGECYEAVWRVLGDEDFFALCREFIAGHSSTSHNLSHYGENFPDFLEQEQQEFPFLSRLAFFEREYRCAFHDLDVSPDLSLIGAADDASNICLRFAPSFRLFSFPHAIQSIWEKRTDESEDATSLAWDQPEHFFLSRKDFQMATHRLTKIEHAVVSSLVAGHTLEQALSRTEGAAFTASDAESLFQRLVASGAVVGAELQSQS